MCSHSPIQPDGQNDAKPSGQAAPGERERECEPWVAATSAFLASLQSLPTTRIYMHD